MSQLKLNFKNKKVPVRKCIVTGVVLPKKDLIRVVLTKEKAVIVDSTGKINGKGFYLQPKIEVLEKAQKTKILQKVLKLKISDEIYEGIRSEIIKIN